MPKAEYSSVRRLGESGECLDPNPGRRRAATLPIRFALEGNPRFKSYDRFSGFGFGFWPCLTRRRNAENAKTSRSSATCATGVEHPVLRMVCPDLDQCS
jgi:hypothetical protein